MNGRSKLLAMSAAALLLPALLTACSPGIASDEASHGSSPEAGQVTERDPHARQQFADFGKCMREQGVSDYPDDVAAQAEFEAASRADLSAMSEVCAERTFGDSGSRLAD